MTRATRLSLTTIAATLILAAGGCAPSGRYSGENGLWKLVTGHPKPIILRKPEAISCEPTLGEPDCYPSPPGGAYSTQSPPSGVQQTESPPPGD